MAITSFMALFAIIASVVVFFVARKRLSLVAASSLSALTFLSVAAASVVFISFALSGMDG